MNRLDDSLEIETRACPYRNDESDKVALLLDVRNVTSKLGTNTKVDFAKILKDVIGNRKCVAAIAVDGIQFDEKGRDCDKDFHRELRRAGFRVDLVRPSNNKGKQDGVDIEISILAYQLVSDKVCDVVELITGDGDFHVLVDRLHDRGAIVNVTAFSRSLSYLLAEQADNVTLLDNMTAIKMQPGIKGVA